jgi:hypothetical protein
MVISIGWVTVMPTVRTASAVYRTGADRSTAPLAWEATPGADQTSTPARTEGSSRLAVS